MFAQEVWSEFWLNYPFKSCFIYVYLTHVSERFHISENM